MQINDNFYGSERTVLSNGMECLPYNMGDALNEGDLPFNEEWDKTICPWGIGMGSDVFNQHFPLPQYDSVAGTIDWQENPLYTNDDYYPFCLTVDGTDYIGTPSNGLYWQCRNAYDVEEITLDGTVTNWRNFRRIVSKFNYQKMCVLIRIGKYNSGYINWYDMYNFFDNGYTDVAAIQFILYYQPENSSGDFNQAPFDITLNSMALGKENTGFQSGDYGSEWIDYSKPVVGGNTPSIGQGTSAAVGFIGEIVSADGTKPVIISENWTNTYVYRNNSRQYYEYRQGLDTTVLDTTDKLKHYIYTQAAYLGFYFTDKVSNLQGAEVILKGNPAIAIGEINSHGITTGNYFWGDTTLDQTGWNDPWDYSPFNPIPDPDPTDWDPDQTSVLQTTTGDPSYGTKEFLMTATALQQLLKVLEEFKVGEAEGDIAPGYCEKAFGSTDPIESIISVIKYPFDMISNWAGSGTVVNGSDVGAWLSFANAQIAVSIGTGTAPPYTILIPSAHDIYEIQWGSTVWKYGRATIPYFNKYQCFLDYEPYCTASLYIPFCGSVRLDPEVYVAHTVGVEYYVSPLDGTIKAYVLRDNLVIDTLAGNIGTSIEINSSDDLAKANNVNLLNSTIQAQKMTLVKQAASFAVGTGITAAFSPLSAGLSAARGSVDLIGNAMLTENALERLEYQIDTAQTPFKQLQAGGGYLSSCDEWGVRLVAYRPVLLSGYQIDNWNNYGHLEGFACYSTGTLADYAGYTVCSDADLGGIACTSTEKEMIFKLLQAGIYI